MVKECKWYLRSEHKVSKCGRNSYHIYVPKELDGKGIIGLIYTNDDTEY